MAKTNKTEKEILEKQEELSKKKNEKQKTSLGRQNEIIREIRKELYGDDAGIEAGKETNYEKDLQEIRKEIYGEKAKPNENLVINPQSSDPIINDANAVEKIESKRKKPKWAMTQEEAEHISDEKIDDLLKFAENLDYDKYLKDQEIREALNLIKYKVEQKDKENLDENDKDQEKENEEKKDEIKEEEEGLKLPPIHTGKPLEHGKEWDPSIKVGENMTKTEEKLKKAVADEVLKSNPVRIQ